MITVMLSIFLCIIGIIIGIVILYKGMFESDRSLGYHIFMAVFGLLLILFSGGIGIYLSASIFGM